MVTLPSGHTYLTTPGSALLFPALMTPTGGITVADSAEEPGGDKTAKMPRRTRTRAQNRAAYISAERAKNRADRADRRTHPADPWGPYPPPPPDSEPPPF